jgi:hypothetical protein
MTSMVSPPTSRFCFWRDGQPLGYPEEWQDGVLEVPCPQEVWQDAQMTVNGRRLELFVQRLAGRTRVLATWERANAGHYHVKAMWPGHKVEETFTVRPSKLSDQAFSALLEDLETRLPAEIAVALKQGGGLVGIKVTPAKEMTAAAELARLRRAVSGANGAVGLTTILKALSRQPYAVLRHTDQLMRYEAVRRHRPSRLVEALMAYHRHEHGQPSKMHDERVTSSVDVLENRLVKLFHHQVSLRLKRLSNHLAHTQNTEGYGEVEKLRATLELSRRQAAFLNDVSLPGYLPQQVTMVFLNVPMYRAALGEFLDFNRSFTARFEGPELEAPLENLPYLYEAWGVLCVIKVLLETACSIGYRVKTERLFRRQAGSAFVDLLPGGRSLLVLVHPVTKTVLKLYGQRSYGKSSPLRSVSYTQVPDIAVEIVAEGKTAVALFDPKYKLNVATGSGGPEVGPDGHSESPGTPKKVDIDKMHAYRDAIRDQKDRRVVAYAGILYPGTYVRYGPGLEAIGADPAKRGVLEESLRQAIAPLLLPQA